MAAILVVEDDERVAQQLFNVFFGRGHLVAVARPDVKPTALQQSFADLLVFDVDRWCGGNSMFRLSQAEAPARPPTLFLTRSRSLLRNGCGYNPARDDFVTKPLDVFEVSSKAETLLGRRREGLQASSRAVLFAGPVCVDLKNAEASVQGQVIPLTTTEFHLLRYLVSNAGEVVSGERLLRDVWGYRGILGPLDLVRAHIKNLRAKIGFHDVDPFRVVQTIPRRGYTVRRDVANWRASA